VLLREDSAEPWLIAATAPDGGCLLRFNRSADFHATRREIRVAPRGFVRPATLRHLLLDQVLPLALAASGETVFHAAAVSRHDTTIVICGAAGTGKSTMAAALASGGFTLRADDGVLVTVGDDVRVTGSYPGLRLWPASADRLGFADRVPVSEGSAKVRVRAPGATDGGSAPVDRLYVLARGDHLAFEALRGHAAIMALLANAYRFDLRNQEALDHQLTRVQRLASMIAVWRVSVPDDLAQVMLAAEGLADHARARWPR
jgi:hypothetical protein